MASEIASQAAKPELVSNRMEQLASQGLNDPGSLRPEDIKQLCGAVVDFIEGVRKTE